MNKVRRQCVLCSVRYVCKKSTLQGAFSFYYIVKGWISNSLQSNLLNRLSVKRFLNHLAK